MNNSEFSARWQEIEDSKKPLIKQRGDISSAIRRMGDDQEKLKTEYLENNAFSVGTKVTLNFSCSDRLNGKHYLVFENHVTGFMTDPTISYNLTTPKKDGSLPLVMLKGVDYVGHSHLIEGWV